MKTRPQRIALKGPLRAVAVAAVGLPVLAGFGIPLFVFGGYALQPPRSGGLDRNSPPHS